MQSNLVINNRKNETEGEFYYEGKCDYCQTPFKARRSNVKYCSKYCALRFHYEKHKKKMATNPKKNHKKPVLGSKTNG